MVAVEIPMWAATQMNRAKFLRFSLLGLLAFSLSSAHVFVSAKGGSYVGSLIIADHFFNLGFVLSLLWVCTAVGLQLLDLVGFEFVRPIDALIFSVAIGSSAVAISILALGFLSALQPIALAGTMVMWVLLAKRKIARVGDLLIRASKEFKANNDALSLTVAVIVAMFMISQALLPPRDWDSLMYHLRVPLQFLDAGKIYLPEDSLHAAFIQLIHMLYLPLLAGGSLVGPALLSTAFALYLGLTTYAVASHLNDRTTAQFSQLLLWVSPMIPLIAITPRADVTLAFYLLLSHFALFQVEHDSRFLGLAAVLLGLAIGVKHNGILYGLALTPFITFVIYKTQDEWLKRLSVVSKFSVLSIAGASPWLLKNWWLFGSPLYPFHGQRKVDGWLSFLYSEEVFEHSINPKIWTALTEVFHRFSLWDFVTNKMEASPELEAVHYLTSPLFLVLCLLFCKRHRLTVNVWLIVPTFAFILFTAMTSATLFIRYFLPSLAPLTIVAVALLVKHYDVLFNGSRQSKIFCRLVAIVLLVPTLQMMFHWNRNNLTIHYLFGRIAPSTYLKQSVLPPGHAEHHHMASYINNNREGVSKVLMLFEARGLYFDVPVIQDNLLTNWALLAARYSELDCLKSTTISHVLLNGAALDYNLRRGLDPKAIRWSEFQAFRESCLAPVYHGPNGYVLYEIRK